MTVEEIVRTDSVYWSRAHLWGTGVGFILPFPRQKPWNDMMAGHSPWDARERNVAYDVVYVVNLLLLWRSACRLPYFPQKAVLVLRTFTAVSL